jgi:hypothetical protein
MVLPGDISRPRLFQRYPVRDSARAVKGLKRRPMERSMQQRRNSFAQKRITLP